VVQQPVFNESIPNGGNPLQQDVNLTFTGFEYHYVYLIVCGFLVWLIIPGIGLLYGGLASRKSALALLFQSFMIIAV
jgi:Amt family ammonium transporter